MCHPYDQSGAEPTVEEILDFDFDFDAAVSRSSDPQALLDQVSDFLLSNPEIRGIAFYNFYEEFRQKTNLEVDINALGNLIKAAGDK